MSNRLIRLARQVERVIAKTGRRDIFPSEAAVLVALADDARDGEGGLSRLGAGEIARRTKLSLRSVRSALAVLQASALISRVPGGTGMVSTTVVHPIPESSQAVARVQPVHGTRAAIARDPCSDCTGPIETPDSTILPMTSAGAREPVEVEVDQVFAEWDRIAAKHGLPGCPIERDAARVSALRGHLKTKKLYLLLGAIGQVDRARGRMSKVTPGQGDFLASFDWTFDVGNRSGMRMLTKLIEGEFNLGRAVPPDEPSLIPPPSVEGAKCKPDVIVADDPPELAQVRLDLCEAVGVPSYESWLRPLAFVDVDGDRLRLAAPTHFVADWVTSNFLERLRGLATTAWGRPLKVELIVVRQLTRAGPEP